MRISRIYSTFLLAATVVFLTSPAHAENWFFVTESDDIKFFLDRDSISLKGKLSEVKTFEVRHKPEDDGTVAAIVKREYSCQEKKSRVKQVTTLFDDSSMRVFKETTSWELVKAETVDAFILQKACEPK
ncbi:MAG: hypothetical protein H7Z11_13010 [Verrucomicrobia bacterium]|nr:hypothetical protein [Leptolyngbya sp. ES-bin-22]